MKAAVIYEKGGPPRYTEIPEPAPRDEDELLVTVRAAALKHVDRSRATGQHYSTQQPGNSVAAHQAVGSGIPQQTAGSSATQQTANSTAQSNTSRVIGGDGVCILSNGTRVYAISSEGMLSERTLIDKDRIAPIPENLDDATAAALPNAVIGSAMGLRFKAGIQAGDVVLVNGATGFTGRVAVQIAKYYGAKKVIATGRDPKGLQELLTLGADEIMPITPSCETFKSQLQQIHAATPIDIIIDYLWGHTAEMILACIKGNGSFTNRIRYVSIGSMAGDIIQLSAANLRSVDLQLTGSGLGAWSKPQVAALFKEILPDMFRRAAEGKLRIDTVTAKLEDIEKCWDLDIPGGRRLVITIP